MSNQDVTRADYCAVAIAEAFRNGNIGVMDLYRLQNVQADTDMRSAIADDRDR